MVDHPTAPATLVSYHHNASALASTTSTLPPKEATPSIKLTNNHTRNECDELQRWIEQPYWKNILLEDDFVANERDLTVDRIANTGDRDGVPIRVAVVGQQRSCIE